MTHEPLCYMSEGKWDGGCQCDLISRVREDERNKLLPAHWSQDWHLGYRQGVADTEKRLRDGKDSFGP